VTLSDPQGLPLTGLPPRPADGPGTDAARARVAELAREFESVLIAQMLRQMRQSFLSEEDQDQGLGGQTLTDTMDVEVARALAAQGGVGLASVIERSLASSLGRQGADGDAMGLRGAGVPSGIVGPSTRPVGPVALPPLPGVNGGPTVSPGVSGAGVAGPSGEPEEVVLTSPLGSAVTSSYGWRTDPFHGLQRFHAGVDFRAAYGREVPTAAPGRVVSAGEQGGYGQTVVVEHADGLQTRYAHLSAILVTPGQELASGDTVGRVGQSGRATGPHLHFEVVLNGQRVDPARVAMALPGALKLGGAAVDSSFDRVPAEAPGDRSEP